MSPNIQIITGYIIIGICAVVGFMGGLMVRSGYEKKKERSTINQPTSHQIAPESQTREKESKQKIIKIQIGRLIEDAAPWLDERIEQDKEKTNKIANLFNKYGVVRSGEHIGKQIDRTNNFIRSINEYIKEINRKIEDILLNLGEERLGSVTWLKDEYKQYTDFLDKVKVTKNSIKQQNDGVCLRFTDKTTFDNILKANPYTE